MSPPEIWGPAIWTFFHTLIEKLNEQYYVSVSPQLYNFFIRICKFLPCPECATDASNFLAKTHFSNLKTKNDLRILFYLLHNWVNARKRKRLFNFGYINIYSNYIFFH